uniref:RING-box protein 1a n=1 Tax=Triticum urartu TaxID=4572 RepID=A0A8R7QUA9_TRIUA
MDQGDVDVAVAVPPAAPSSSCGGAGCKKGKRFEIKKWNAVALWAWDIVVDNCAICRNHIMDLCEHASRSPLRIDFVSTILGFSV